MERTRQSTHTTVGLGTYDADSASQLSTTSVRRLLIVMASLLGIIGSMAFASMAPPNVATLDPRVLALYSQHASSPPRTEIIPLYLDRTFSDVERANVLRAASEWNLVLNGHIRFEVEGQPSDARAPDLRLATNNPRSWIVIRDASKADMRLIQRGEAVLGRVIHSQSGGGVMMLASDPFYRVDLARVALHEFGHVLGLGHDPRSHLMSVRYWAEEQRCVDRETVELLATLRRLPFEELNWCTVRSRGLFSSRTTEEGLAVPFQAEGVTIVKTGPQRPWAPQTVTGAP